MTEGVVKKEKAKWCVVLFDLVEGVELLEGLKQLLHVLLGGLCRAVGDLAHHALDVAQGVLSASLHQRLLHLAHLAQDLSCVHQSMCHVCRVVFVGMKNGPHHAALSVGWPEVG